MSCDQNSSVNYKEFLRLVNWRDFPVAAISTNAGQPETYHGNAHKDELQSVNVALLRKDL